eukprot:gnl/TRDRNA2_/TRDRNA2_173707_c0_seq1.p1 gnl/TRDRNA2_/TRDRNA2_173707_c0~~gnl/TRDRNA2_/TRDRNA2_173707_c0_seq1.p1  ORF type:complete len:137 (+),score=2.57 gnl/TRDRNA2_/TRDRNA2_173707_c0_seq1:187-597(+)
MIINLGRSLKNALKKNCLQTFTSKNKKKLLSFASKKCTSDNNTLSYERIEEEVEEAYRQIMDLGIKRATRQEYKPSDIRNNKKKVARLLTARRKLQIADGVSNSSFRWEKTLKKIKFSKCSLMTSNEIKNLETISQ